MRLRVGDLRVILREGDIIEALGVGSQGRQQGARKTNENVTSPMDEFLQLKGTEEDMSDLWSAVEVLECIEAGEGNLAAGPVIGRLLEGDSPPNVRREHCQVSQAELAGQSRVHRVQSIDVEAGLKTGSAFTLNRLAAALDVDLDDIVTGLR